MNYKENKISLNLSKSAKSVVKNNVNNAMSIIQRMTKGIYSYCLLLLQAIEQIMKLGLLLTGILILAFQLPGFSQKKITVEEYIDKYQDLAIEEMKKHHIPASIKMAQAILESGSGNSELAVNANNHFGIKCHREWTGKTYHKDDDAKDECFRKYKSAEDSYLDHSHFLTSRDRYKPLFDLEITDYKGWAYGLKQAGYATNPRYPDLLIRIIEENGLARLDAGRRSSHGTRNPEPGTRNISGIGGNNRMVFLNNDVRFILARPGDDLKRIGKEFGLSASSLKKYNDFSGKVPLTPGSKVYLEKKKTRHQQKKHQVKTGETLHAISQDYGIRLKPLSRRNGLKPDEVLVPGNIIRLR